MELMSANARNRSGFLKANRIPGERKNRYPGDMSAQCRYPISARLQAV
jgi:hypothetical protein